MIMLIFAFLTSVTWSSVPVHWSTLIEIRERHEFYQDNEVIIRPKGAWQTLFAVVYPDKNLRLHKDCIFYRVPAEDDGVLKIKSVILEEVCEKFMDQKGDTEIANLRSLQFAFTNELVLYFTFSDYRSLRWTIPLMNKFKSHSPTPFSSSAQYRAPQITLLAPAKEAPKGSALQKKNNESCHPVGDDCAELAPSDCNQCPEGWYEVPNGCPQGPKYCGVQVCGLKNRPACRRGMKYQRVRKKYECSTDASFAYCAPGLTVQCEGSRVICR